MAKFLMLITCVFGTIFGNTALAANTATLTWAAPTLNTDGTPITQPLTYKIFQGVSGQPKTVIQTSVTATTFKVTTGLNPGTTVCWELTALGANADESDRTGEVCAMFPPSKTGAPTNLKVTIP